MLADTQVLWPEGEPYERLMKIKVFEGNAAFQSEKQNEPYDAERSLFNPDTFATFTWDKPDRLLTLPNRRAGLSALHTIHAFWDPAVGNDDSSDYAAIVVGGMDAHGYVYVLDAWLGKEKPHQQLEAAVHLYKQWGFTQLGIEGNGFQALVVREARERFNKLGNGCRVLKAKSTSNKDLRIASLEPKVNNGSLIFRQDIAPVLFDQLKYFPTATHDDGPDALAGVVKSLATKAGHNQPLQRRRARRR
jgi:predicted phage terminase large subunit-like protein